MVKLLKLIMVNQIQPRLTNVKPYLKNSTMGYFGQTKDKHGSPKYIMVHYNVEYMLTQPNIQYNNNVTFAIH